MNLVKPMPETCNFVSQRSELYPTVLISFLYRFIEEMLLILLNPNT